MNDDDIGRAAADPEGFLSESMEALCSEYPWMRPVWDRIQRDKSHGDAIAEIMTDDDLQAFAQFMLRQIQESPAPAACARSWASMLALGGRCRGGDVSEAFAHLQELVDKERTAREARP